jgi:hypothetical protein
MTDNPPAELGKIDVYSVGLLSDLAQFVHTPDRKHARRMLRYRLRYPLSQARAGNWRAVRMWFNGYLAEPSEWPGSLSRCGSGWTRGRAYRDLLRHAERAMRETRHDV